MFLALYFSSSLPGLDINPLTDVWLVKTMSQCVLPFPGLLPLLHSAMAGTPSEAHYLDKRAIVGAGQG